MLDQHICVGASRFDAQSRRIGGRCGSAHPSFEPFKPQDAVSGEFRDGQLLQIALGLGKLDPRFPGLFELPCAAEFRLQIVAPPRRFIRGSPKLPRFLRQLRVAIGVPLDLAQLRLHFFHFAAGLRHPVGPAARREDAVALFRDLAGGFREAGRADAGAVELPVDFICFEQCIAGEFIEREGEDVLEHILGVSAEQLLQCRFGERGARSGGDGDRPSARALVALDRHALARGTDDVQPTAVAAAGKRRIVLASAAQGEAEEDGADRREQRALARFVGAEQHGQGRVEGAERVVGEVPEAVQVDALDLHASSSTSKSIAIASASCSSAAKSSPCGVSSPMKRKRWLP